MIPVTVFFHDLVRFILFGFHIVEKIIPAHNQVKGKHKGQYKSEGWCKCTKTELSKVKRLSTSQHKK